MYGIDHTGSGLMGGFGMILIWLVLIALVAGLLVQRRGRNSKAAAMPLEILDARYARGEIGREEYLSRRADMTAGAAN
ncbi:MAG: SHOCT domain-containing protein [Gammaproteobacteria bacterium]|nr:SHOCT domain-containing protein [Gammaproteobacteria bacterium]MBU1646488.1 SHOCT domain-containing protein [Gammaproteobacteria bacterium]MBU1971031.1 SHOCT domain-containing protein [Gammaproteobacteria bacterium]